ncbi:MAG: FAD-dependent oxidoreductase [Blautia sp.]
MRQIETDVAVIGAGPAGLSAASQAAAAGARVTLIDENKSPAGNCSNRYINFWF